MIVKIETIVKKNKEKIHSLNVLALNDDVSQCQLQGLHYLPCKYTENCSVCHCAWWANHFCCPDDNPDHRSDTLGRRKFFRIPSRGYQNPGLVHEVKSRDPHANAPLFLLLYFVRVFCVDSRQLFSRGQAESLARFFPTFHPYLTRIPNRK